MRIKYRSTNNFAKKNCGVHISNLFRCNLNVCSCTPTAHDLLLPCTFEIGWNFIYRAYKDYKLSCVRSYSFLYMRGKNRTCVLFMCIQQCTYTIASSLKFVQVSGKLLIKTKTYRETLLIDPADFICIFAMNFNWNWRLYMEFIFGFYANARKYMYIQCVKFTRFIFWF